MVRPGDAGVAALPAALRPGGPPADRRHCPRGGVAAAAAAAHAAAAPPRHHRCDRNRPPAARCGGNDEAGRADGGVPGGILARRRHVALPRNRRLSALRGRDSAGGLGAAGARRGREWASAGHRGPEPLAARASRARRPADAALPARRAFAELAAAIGREFTLDLLIAAGNGDASDAAPALDEL